MMTRLNTVDWVAIVLLIIGGLNWGIIGLFGVDVVASLLGGFSPLARAVYVLVGVASIYGIFSFIAKVARKAPAMGREKSAVTR